MSHAFFIDFDLNNMDFYYHGLSVIIFIIIILLFLFISVCRFCRVLRCYTLSLQRENANKYLTWTYLQNKVKLRWCSLLSGVVLVGRLAGTSAACTYFADTFTTAKRTDGTFYEILGNAQLSFRCCVGLAQLKETPAHRTATWLRLRSYLRRCTTEPSPHLPPAMFAEVTSATLRAHSEQGLSTAR